MVRRALEASGEPPREIYWARNGLEAIQFLVREGKFAARGGADPDLVLLDVKLPLMDGYEVLKEVRSRAPLRQIPIVVFSTTSREEDIIRAMELGADDYVVKPAAYQDFVEVIKEIGRHWASGRVGSGVD